MITLQTNFGNITIELDTVNTPITALNFAQYVKEGFYDGTIFHRVINSFMVQGGGFDADMRQKKTRATIVNEAKKAGANKRGTLAMARTSDPHSASPQFFINVVDNPFLNFTAETTNGWGYCVFGKVVEGMDVVDKIKAVATTTKADHSDVPALNVLIEKAWVNENNLASA